MQLYQYPVLSGPTAVLANKSFFMADRVQMQWNRKGETTGALTQNGHWRAMLGLLFLSI